MKIANSMLDLIGDIPLVRLNRIGRETGAEILVKPEFLNPSGSIKDRIARRMVEDAERAGSLVEGSTIVEATTGNTGTALAFVAAVKGYGMHVFVPSEVFNRTRFAIMLAYGCTMEVVTTDSSGATGSGREDVGQSGIHGSVVELQPRILCREMERRDPAVWWARQFFNPANVLAHRESTGEEILAQTDGRLHAFVASVGTGGTLLGTAQTLKNYDPSILIVGVEPEDEQLLSRPENFPIIEGISDGIIPDLRASGLLGLTLTVGNQEAVQMAHQLAEREGIFAGVSSGANVAACVRLAQELGPGKRIVTVLPDSRDRYLEVERYTT